MNPYNREARRRITQMPAMAEYRILMQRAKPTPIERAVCDLKYLDGQNLAYIGDKLGYSESGIKRIHRRALQKISKLI